MISLLEDKVLSRVADLSLEDTVAELQQVSKLVTPPQSKRWFKIYENFLNDRRVYRAIGVEDHYAGEPDGRINEVVSMKLKLLSFYAYVAERKMSLEDYYD